MAAANDLRPVQARGNLERMMQRQLELRKEETKAIHAKCDALEARLEELRLSTQQASSSTAGSGTQAGLVTGLIDEMQGIVSHAPTNISQPASITAIDVLRWSEEIG